MTSNRISLFRFMTAGLLTFLLLMVLQAMCFVQPAHFASCHFLFFGWKLANAFFHIIVKRIDFYPINAFSCSVPSLGRYLGLNTMSVYNDVS